MESGGGYERARGAPMFRTSAPGEWSGSAPRQAHEAVRVLRAEVEELEGMHHRGEDLRGLDEPRPRAVEVRVAVGEEHVAAGARGPRQRLDEVAQRLELHQRALEREAARLDQ